jgi:tripartite-type tricarboxylate transporter receptor subunit TctC
MEEASYRLVISKPDEFAAAIRKDAAFWADFVKTSGFTL